MVPITVSDKPCWFFMSVDHQKLRLLQTSSIKLFELSTFFNIEWEGVVQSGLIASGRYGRSKASP